MDDLISRQSAKDIMFNIRTNRYNNDKHFAELCLEEFDALPSAQQEIKPIDYRDCANAMLKMWMLDVVTDGEYYKIMDKLNKFEMERRTNDSD